MSLYRPDQVALPSEILSFTVDPAQAHMRLDVFVSERAPFLTRTRVQKLIELGKVQVAARSARAALRLQSGERVTVTIDKDPRDLLHARREPLALAILHEDEDLIAVDKPAGVASHPAGRHVHRTAVTWLRTERPAAPDFPKLCHRLDRETSGVLIAAKIAGAHRQVLALIARGELQKVYRAIVHGIVARDAFAIDWPLGEDPRSPVAHRRCADPGGRQQAFTSVVVEQRLERFTVVRLTPTTGRRHQLRVHLSAIGHPIVGDKLYSVPAPVFLRARAGRLTAEDDRLLMLDRHALHATAVVLPWRGRELQIVAAWPPELAQFVSQHGGA